MSIVNLSLVISKPIKTQLWQNSTVGACLSQMIYLRVAFKHTPPPRFQSKNLFMQRLPLVLSYDACQ